MKDTSMLISPTKMPPSISFTEDELDGIGDLNLDDKVSLRLECKVNEISRREYDKGNPMSARFSVLSAEVVDSDIVSKIKGAKTNKELEGIMDD